MKTNIEEPMRVVIFLSSLLTFKELAPIIASVNILKEETAKSDYVIMLFIKETIIRLTQRKVWNEETRSSLRGTLAVSIKKVHTHDTSRRPEKTFSCYDCNKICHVGRNCRSMNRKERGQQGSNDPFNKYKKTETWWKAGAMSYNTIKAVNKKKLYYYRPRCHRTRCD